MKRVIAYIRVSTEEQHIGPQAQRAAIDAWADRCGGHVVSYHEDRGVSGGADIDKCPGLLAAIDALGKGDTLIVAKRDRLGRDVIRCAMAERLAARKGARVVSADGVGDGDGPEAQLIRGVVDVFAQYERVLIGARTRGALGVLSSQGVRLGAEPLGARRTPTRAHDGRLAWAEDDDEQQTLDIMRDLYRGGATYRAVAAELTRLGRKTKRGGKWDPKTVKRQLDRMEPVAA